MGCLARQQAPLPTGLSYWPWKTTFLSVWVLIDVLRELWVCSHCPSPICHEVQCCKQNGTCNIDRSGTLERTRSQERYLTCPSLVGITLIGHLHLCLLQLMGMVSVLEISYHQPSVVLPFLVIHVTLRWLNPFPTFLILPIFCFM